jgi:O-antigen ligase
MEAVGARGRAPALTIFTLLLLAAPLLFGASDRITQVALTALLGLGMFFAPPVIQIPQTRTKWAIAAILLVLLFKETAPAIFFGDTLWRRVLAQSFAFGLPPSHHPEPATAFDALLVGVIGTCWFLWARRLAADHRNTRFIAWSLFGSAVALALVSLSTQAGAESMIYGVRYTPGWTGYGPFPNRNHTACFLAMGAMMGCGCLLRAGWRRKPVAFAVALAGLGAVIIALLQSKSRGGLVAFCFGLTFLGGLTTTKIKNRKASLIALGGYLIVASICLAFGAKVLSRFNVTGDLPANLRWQIWGQTLAMWRDASFFGHGISTFQQLFPFYQNLNLDNSIVLHPESDWLKWLVELGAVLLLLIVFVSAGYIFKHLKRLSLRGPGFFLRAGAFCAMGTLLIHALWDVPAHRWAIAWYGLAMLAFAAPSDLETRVVELRRRSALIPTCVALIWAIPFFWAGPAWSPTHLDLLLARNSLSTAVRTTELEAELPFFPLNAQLHQAIGVRKLSVNPPAAWKHFWIADRLMPGSWVMPASQALASRGISPGMTLHFWTLAVERAGRRSEEIFRMAISNTAGLPLAEASWASYAEAHPPLLLSYAQTLPDNLARYYYSLWWASRAASPELEPQELEHFYAHVARWGDRSQFDEWMGPNAARESADYVAWARALREFKDEAGAWKLLSRHVPEPAIPLASAQHDDHLEMRWLSNPSNFVDAQAFAASELRIGELEKAKQVIFRVAENRSAPEWFVRKAAYLHAADKDYGSAVNILLR